MSGEFEIIERIRSRAGEPPPGQVWIGDDAAVLDGGLLAAADVVVEGVHFTSDTPLADVGWKAAAVNVSDIAAMGGRPTALLVTVAAPAATDVESLYDGLFEAVEEYGCPVVGGDLSEAGVLSVSVTVLGRVDGDPVLRSGARSGDEIWVSGPLGGAAAAGYRARPVARVGAGTAARRAGATAMIDVSDGLAPDLNHIARASGVGVVVDVDAVPLAGGASIAQALGGGEDFELVFTLPPGALAPDEATRIGVCTSDPGQLVAGRGWEHFG